MEGEPTVFSAGTVNADLVLRVGRPLESGASVIAERLLRTSGGRAANVAVMACRLGTRSRLFGCVGTDELANQALAGPRQAGVDLTGIGHVPGDTGLAAIIVGEAGAKTMVFAPGANDGFSDADGRRLAEAVRGAPERSVLVVDTELSPAAVVPALEAARAEGRPVVLDPSRPERVTGALLELSDHVTPNADEATRLTGIRVESATDAERAAYRLRERGARNIHVRLPFGGCLTLGPDGEALLRAPADLEVIDTTGAGDAFAGALATAIVADRPLVDAARFAVAAASCAVTGFGAQESYPDRSLLEAMAQRVTVAIHQGVSAHARARRG